MPKLRALVVDDAVVMRRLVSAVLESDPDIEVAGTAPNGVVALQKLPQLNPDFVTLDLEMPEMDGLATLAGIRRTHPRLPVIMFSLATQRGAVSTLDALAAGANDYVTKPTHSSSLDASFALLQQELLAKVHAHCRQTRPTALGTNSPTKAAAPALRHASRGGPVDLLCIGTSTGGPNALSTVFSQLTQPIPVPVAIVQHMPPLFTSSLAERLNRLSPHLRCTEARDGEVMHAGVAYLAPGGRHLSVGLDPAGEFICRLSDDPPENSCRPAVDVLFRSAAAAAGSRVLGVVMTGMGHDGLRGTEHITEAGGSVFAQDEATSVVWGMPGAVAARGLCDTLVPLPRIAAELTRRLGAIAA